MLPPRWPSGSVLLVILFVGHIRAVRMEHVFSIKAKCCSRINTLQVVDTCLDCEFCWEAPPPPPQLRTGGEHRASGLVNCKHARIVCPQDRPPAGVTLFSGGGGLVTYSRSHREGGGSPDLRPGISSPDAVDPFVCMDVFVPFRGHVP